MKNLIVIIAIFLGVWACNSDDYDHSIPIGDNESGENIDQDTVYKVLFIGSSYFAYNNMPQMVARFCTAGNRRVLIDGAIIPGQLLEDHNTFKSTSDKIKRLDWDYVVLQGVGMNVAYPDGYPEYPGKYKILISVLKEMKEKILDNHPETKIIYCMPWAYEDGMTWFKDGTDTYEMMQDKIYKNTLAFADSVDLMIAPVGEAWREIIKKNTSLHYLFDTDFNHPSKKGSYVLASTIYSSIYKESTKDLNFYFGLPRKEVDFFKSVSDSVVLNHLKLWRLEE